LTLPTREVFVRAANANRYVQEYRVDQEWWASCWSEEVIARNPPVRVEFEHATFFGSLTEALSVRKGKTSWGSLLRVDPFVKTMSFTPHASSTFLKRPTECVRGGNGGIV
jgi:hypothetical protein